MRVLIDECIDERLRNHLPGQDCQTVRYAGQFVKAVVVFAGEEENRGMATEYIGLPGELVEKVKEAAAREEITPEELVRDAVENRLSRAEWRKTVEFGHRNARERGLKPEDVDAEISAARAELSR